MLVSIVRNMRLKTHANRWHLHSGGKEVCIKGKTIPSKSRSWWPHEWRHPNVTLFEGVLLTLMKLPPDGHLRSRHCENPVNLPVPLLHGQPFVCNKLIFDTRLNKVNFSLQIKKFPRPACLWRSQWSGTRKHSRQSLCCRARSGGKRVLQEVSSLSSQILPQRHDEKSSVEEFVHQIHRRRCSEWNVSVIWKKEMYAIWSPFV